MSDKGEFSVSVKMREREKNARENNVHRVNISIRTTNVNENGENFVHGLRVSARRRTRTVIYLVCKIHVWCGRTGYLNPET